jgi:uncharacterized RmlC-like cupin family protein
MSALPPLRRIRPDELSSETAQTPGMQRHAAISQRTVGSRELWMGRTVVEAGSRSVPHHHGPSETAIYVVSGHPVFRFIDGDQEVELRAAPGDYVFVPPHVPHVEENPNDEDAVVVIARSTQEAIVENLDAL